MKKRILILGVGGFIGSSLSEMILKQREEWSIVGMDLSDEKIKALLGHPRFEFHQRDITKSDEWIQEQIARCDFVFPLVAIANPATYVSNPLKVFELDFEENIKIVRWCFEQKKYLIFPSTSEVYGMCTDEEFCEKLSNFVTGPVNKTRWIYSTSKQLLDRVIYAYGEKGLNYTLFRPFNWIGPHLDGIVNKVGGSRVVTQFISDIIHGQTIQLVGGGAQRRCFTDIDDGVDALIRIMDHSEGEANRRIFNIGNPDNNFSIKELAELLVGAIKQYPKYAHYAAACKIVNANPTEHFGAGYQDVTLRVPSVQKAKQYLQWAPKVTLAESIKKILDFHLA